MMRTNPKLVIHSADQVYLPLGAQLFRNLKKWVLEVLSLEKNLCGSLLSTKLWENTALQDCRSQGTTLEREREGGNGQFQGNFTEKWLHVSPCSLYEGGNQTQWEQLEARAVYKSLSLAFLETVYVSAYLHVESHFSQVQKPLSLGYFKAYVNASPYYKALNK